MLVRGDDDVQWIMAMNTMTMRMMNMMMLMTIEMMAIMMIMMMIIIDDYVDDVMVSISAACCDDDDDDYEDIGDDDDDDDADADADADADETETSQVDADGTAAAAQQKEKSVLEEMSDILATNGIDALVPPLDGTSFYATICKINHSCCPNVIVKYAIRPDVGLVAELTALRAIEAGEELVQSYIDQSKRKIYCNSMQFDHDHDHQQEDEHLEHEDDERDDEHDNEHDDEHDNDHWHYRDDDHELREIDDHNIDSAEREKSMLRMSQLHTDEFLDEHPKYIF